MANWIEKAVDQKMGSTKTKGTGKSGGRRWETNYRCAKMRQRPRNFAAANVAAAVDAEARD